MVGDELEKSSGPLTTRPDESHNAVECQFVWLNSYWFDHLEMTLRFGRKHILSIFHLSDFLFRPIDKGAPLCAHAVKDHVDYLKLRDATGGCLLKWHRRQLNTTNYFTPDDSHDRVDADGTFKKNVQQSWWLWGSTVFGWQSVIFGGTHFPFKDEFSSNWPTSKSSSKRIKHNATLSSKSKWGIADRWCCCWHMWNGHATHAIRQSIL